MHELIEKMEAKIKPYVDSILEKRSINFNDYQVLSCEIMRMHTLLEKEKIDAERAASTERMKEALASIACYCNDEKKPVEPIQINHVGTQPFDSTGFDWK